MAPVWNHESKPRRRMTFCNAMQCFTDPIRDKARVRTLFLSFLTPIACRVMIIHLPRGWKCYPGAVDNALCYGRCGEVVASVTMLEKKNPSFLIGGKLGFLAQ
jgi:hypothetical protein